MYKDSLKIRNPAYLEKIWCKLLYTHVAKCQLFLLAVFGVCRNVDVEKVSLCLNVAMWVLESRIFS